MVYKRQESGVYYIDMEVGGRRLARSTRATNKKKARRIEAAVLDLHDQGRTEIIDALHDGRVSPREVYRARQSNRLDELLRDEADPPLSETIRRFEKITTGSGVKAAMDKVRSVAPDHARTSWLADVENLQDVVLHHREQGLAPGTERRNMAVVSKLLRHAFDPEKRDRLYRQLSFREADNTRCVWLTAEEMAAVEEVSSNRMWALISTAAATGLRLGELLSLRARDVESRDEGAVVRVRGGKTRSARRKVPLYGRPRETLEAWVRRQGPKARERIWPELTNGKVWHRWDDIRTVLKLRAEGGSPVRFHDLRHHFAVHMARQGLPLTELRDLLGHSDLQMVERYAIYTPLPDPERFSAGYRSMGLEGRKPVADQHQDQHEREEAG